jgi:hypothetical protein
MENFLSLLLRFIAIIFPFVRIGEAHSIIAACLILASNAIPVAGVAFLGWDPAFIILIYWAESVIIGLLNILMMIISGIFTADNVFNPARFGAALFFSIFFTVHYGIFMLVHALFIGVLFLNSHFAGNADPVDSFVSSLFSPDRYLPPILFIAACHLYFFFAFFIRNKWYCSNEPQNFMVRPYARVFVMQFTIIIGAFIMAMTGWKLGPVIVWVGAKTITDLISFGWSLRSMKKNEPKTVRG